MLTLPKSRIPTPDLELITTWREQWRRLSGEPLFSWIARKASRWAADEELELTLDQITRYQQLTALQKEGLISYLRATRR